jgi:hypothetical protein
MEMLLNRPGVNKDVHWEVGVVRFPVQLFQFTFEFVQDSFRTGPAGNGRTPVRDVGHCSDPLFGNY